MTKQICKCKHKIDEHVPDMECSECDCESYDDSFGASDVFPYDLDEMTKTTTDGTTKLELNKIHHGDCFEVMDKLIAEGIKVDAIITDPPYGTTACRWDTVIPFAQMWERLNKLIKPNGAIVLFGSEKFSSALRMSNIKNYKYDWVWNKKAFSNQMMAKKQPLRIIENVIVFNSGIYYPQDLIRFGKTTRQGSKITDNIGGGKRPTAYYQEFTNYPKNLIEFSKDRPSFHPTQKPVALMEYLIKTYTNEGELVLDFTCGSGTTCIACIRTNRNFIGIELSEEYCRIANERIKELKAKIGELK